jgi:hypothetical protein
MAAPTVGPTATEMLGHDRLVVDVTTTAGDETNVDINHNMGCATSTGDDGSPEIFAVPLTFGTVLADLALTVKNANAVTAAKVNPTGDATTAGSWRVTIKRPYSVGQ